MAYLTPTPLTLFIAQAVVIITIARVLGLLVKRMGQPMVIAEVLAGILLGPSLFGYLAPDAWHALFPETSLPHLHLLSQIGLIFFMFLIGLELDPRLIRGQGRASVIISYSSIIVPFMIGGALAWYLYPRVSLPDVPFISFALFLGAAMSITAFPVLARILAERRMLRSKVGALTITCAAVNDVMAWCILAFIVSVARSAGIASAIATTVGAGIFVAIMFLVVRPFLTRLSVLGSDPDGLTQNIVAVTFILIFLSSWATELIGIHAVFGAFMLGSVIPKEGGFDKVLGEKLEDLVVVFLLPLFFAYTGLRTEFGLLDSAETWFYCLLIIAVACLGKFGGSAVAARWTGLSVREASALGILMNTRGLMELIVLNIGLDIGVISPTMFAMMVIMAVVTTFITTPLLYWIYPPEKLTETLVDRQELVTTLSPKATPDYTVLMCVSYDASGPGMLNLIACILEKDSQNHRIYALRLIRPTERTSFYLRDEPEQRVERLHPLIESARQIGLTIKPLSFVSSDLSHDICNVADVKGANLILLGWHRPLLSQAILGGTVFEVMQQATADVAVLVDRGLFQLRRILVPFSGGDHDSAALVLATRIARYNKAHLVVLLVKNGTGTELKDDVPADVSSHIDPLGDLRSLCEIKSVTDQNPSHAALLESQQGYDLVVIGIGKNWGLAAQPFDFHPEPLLQECPCSILVMCRNIRQDPQLAD